MPELPEVETVRRSLEPHLVGRRFERVRVFRRDVITGPHDPPGGYARNKSRLPTRFPRITPADLLVGEPIEHVARHGKQLAIVARSGHAILIHLGMTGQVLHLRRAQRTHNPAHVHVSWWTDRNTRLLFRDPRRFGGIWIRPDHTDLQHHWERLGPDALTIRAARLRDIARTSRRPIKALLLDQGSIAGVGNIYADEALFASGIHPTTPAADLTDTQTRLLAASIRRILRMSIRRGGTTLSDFRDADGITGTTQSVHRVYGRAGRPCRRCGSPLSSGQVSQRTSVWCNICQPVGNLRLSTSV